MSTRTLSRCSRRRASSRATPRVAKRAAFTLIELLVVVAVIAILLSILLPALQSARESARAATCGAGMRNFGNGFGIYFAENSEWIPGCNTTGVAVRRHQGTDEAYFNSRMPVQSFDWMTPIVRPSMEMSSSWARRWHDLVNRFMCPSQRTYRAIVYPGSTGIPQSERDFFNNNQWTALSYLMPVHFQHWGLNYRERGPQAYAFGVHAVNNSSLIYAITAPPDPTPEHDGIAWEASHFTYKSRLPEVGKPSEKIAVADGTRYYDATAGYIDFDVSPNPQYFGSFTSSGAWWSGCRSYGVKAGTRNWNNRSVSVGSRGRGVNLELSYRHGPQRGAGASGSAQQNKGRINALFFDGSIRRLNDKESRNPMYWYPSGTKVRPGLSPGEMMIEGYLVQKGSDYFIP